MLTTNAVPNFRARGARAALFAVLVLAMALLALCRPGAANAAVSCPNSNPVVNENNCMGEGTTANQSAMENYSEDIGGFATQSSFNLGENIPLKIGTDLGSFPSTAVDISVYRIGYYGGDGARLISSAGALNVKVNNTFECNPENTTTGELSCSNWSVTYTVPGKSLPISGIYEAVLTDVSDPTVQNMVVFTVRNDSRASDVLYVLPTADYEAYNLWGCKSLYFDTCGGANTIAGDPRAVAVSFDRPQSEGNGELNRFFGPDYDTVFWLEQQGYDVSYTDDTQTDSNLSSLLDHKVDLVSGHSEYWSYNSFNNFKKARDAGVNIVSLSANTAYWQTRYENNHRTLVCYKTIQGNSSGDPGATPNDPAATGPKGEALPQNATTTRRDPGAPAGDPNAPAGGRIGPNEPENSLWGVMYVGDNDAHNFPLEVPAGNPNGEYASSRVWRHTDISPTQGATLPEVVGWEWDQIPTKPSYLAQEPAGVKQVTLTNTTNEGDSWLQDSGRARANTAPSGEPSNVSAVEYRAPSGALVFATGTMEWAFGFGDKHIDQATYNVLSEMGAQPGTPDEDLTLDSPTELKPPWPTFTASPTAVTVGQSVSFDASASKSPNGAITDYKWDLDNSGSFATDTGSSSTLSHVFTKPGVYKVILKVTDAKGQQETTERTVEVANTVTAKIAAAMNPVGAGQKDTLSAAGSSSRGGTVTDYKWDLDGNGTFETDTGTTPTVSDTFAHVGTTSVAVEVTDSFGSSEVATLPVRVIESPVSRYADSVSSQASLLHFYRFDELTGSTIGDSAGSSPGTYFEPVLGEASAVNGDSDTSASFTGSGDPLEGETGSYGEIPMNLSAQSSITVEFWLKWSGYGNNDALAMEFTPNYNENAGGFIVDPNAPEFGGTFGVGIGDGTTRNSVFFARPSAGVWHHYALVLDTTAPAESQITPYVDGQQVSYRKESSNTGTGSFASSTLYLFSRDGKTLFGSGAIDELAVYGGRLPAATIEEQVDSNGPEPRPVATIAAQPGKPHANETVTLDGSGSHYALGSITKYEWDLDGNGSYETSTGTTASVKTSFPSPGTYTVGLRVTDSDGATGTSTRKIEVGSFPPVAKVTVAPSPALTGQQVTLDASGSTDQGAITDYKWDLDNSGNYATDTGSTPKVTTNFPEAGFHTVGVRMTDSQGLTTTTSVKVTVLEQGVSDYEDEVLATAGLTHYWKLGEPAGPTIADSKGTANGTVHGASFGLPGAVAEDPTTSVGFNGAGDYGSVPLDLSSTNKLTVEFWLKWNQYANNDALAMEFTPNFNENNGGFLVDPNAPEFGGTFGVAIGTGANRNSVFLQRPSAGVWHHYAFVIDTTAPGTNVITPYVDGASVPFQQDGSANGQGAFANSTLYLMSRAGSALFGAGQLDQLAIYNTPLSASTIFQHYFSDGVSKAPKASFTATPNPARPGQSITLDASGSTDPNGGIVDYSWDVNGDGTYETDSGSNPILKTSLAEAGTYNIGLRVTDKTGATAGTTRTVTVGNFPPVIKATATPNPVSVGQNVTIDASGSSDQGAITDYKWDLDNSGNYATDTGSTAKLTSAFQTPGAHTVGVEATDDHGLSARTTVTIDVLETTPVDYGEAVRSTPGLLDYYGMGEAKGPTLLDSKGSAPGTVSGGTFGLPGPIENGTAVRFNGSSDSGSIPLDLSGTSKVTLEFWLKWNQYANNDALAMELTPNFNSNAGGILVDPNAGEFGGTFGIAIGTSEDRNSVFFARPSAGVWHHYAIVLDTTAASPEEITPYVDGQAVAVQQESTGSGQGAFANSTLYLMSRAGSSLFGNGTLDQLAVYDAPLSATTIFSHYHSKDVNLSLVPSFTATTTEAVTGENVTFDASGSTDSQSPITDYRWDLDGSGSYATDTGSSPTLTHAFNAASTYVVGLQTTDGAGISARTTQTLTVTVAPPSTPVLTLSGATGNTAISGGTVYTNPQAGSSGAFTVAASTTDSFSGIKDVAFPSLTGFASGASTVTAPPYETTYSWSGAEATAAGPETVTATNNANVSASSTFTVVPDTAAPAGGALAVNNTSATASGSTSYSTNGSFQIGLRSDYSEPQTMAQSGLRSSTLTVASAALAGNVCGAYGAPTTITGAPAQTEPSGCYRYTLTGIDNVGNQASVSTTVMVDTSVPSTPSVTFSGLSSNVFYKSATNALYFRPAAGGAFTVTVASSDPTTGIKSYNFSPLAANGFTETQTAGTMAYTFAATATQPASAPTASATNNAGGTSAAATYSLIADTTGPTGGALSVNGLAATEPGSTSYSRTGSYSIGTRTDYNADAGSGFVSSVLTRATATLGTSGCGTFGTPATISGNPTQSNLAAGCYRYTLTGTDRVGNTSALTTVVVVDKTAPTATLGAPAHTNGPVALTFSATDAGSGVNAAAGHLLRASSTLTATTDSCSNFFFSQDLGPQGVSSPFTDTSVASGKCYEYAYEVSDRAGNTTTSAAATVKVNTTKPTLTGVTDTTAGSSAGRPQVGDVVTLSFSDSIEAASIPANATLTYARPATGSTTVAVEGISSGSWSTGDNTTARYINAAGTSATATAKTTVSGATVKLTITAVTDPSGRFNAGGPATLTGTLAPTLKDVFGNTASTTAFTLSNVRLF